jgi:Ca2+-binding RTX toxin-like protein
MANLVFQVRDINALGLDAPGADTIVWDDLVARIDWEKRLTEDSFGISIPVVDAGATMVLHAHLGIEITLTYDAGTFGVDYVLTDHADGFAEWKDERATPYLPPPDDPDQTPLAQYQNSNPILAPTLDFVTGAMPFAAPATGSRLKAEFVYGMQAGVKDIDLSVDLWIDTVDIITDLDVPLANIPDGRETIFDIGTGDPIDIDLGTFPITIETLKVPDVVTDYAAVVFGDGALPSLTRYGEGDPFFHASFSMAEFLANLFPAFKVLKGTYELNGADTYLYWTLLDVQTNAMVQLVQEVTFDPQGVRLQLDTSLGQHAEGILGDSFVIDTPQGQGRVDASVLYTPHGEYRSRLGVVVSANIEFSAFEIGIHNTAFKDFDVSVGPLVHFFVPDEDGWATDPIWLYENRREVVLDGADSTDGVIGTVATYTAWYQNDVVASDGNDTLQLNDEQVALDAKAGDDVIAGSKVFNNIFGNAGNDTLHGFGSGDLVGGGAGNDVIFGDAGPGLPASFYTGFNKPPVNAGGDILTGGSGDDTIDGQAGDDIITGGDLSVGGSGSDVLKGGAGRDTLFAGSADGGVDALDGGPGTDRAVISRRGSLADFDVQAGIDVILPDGTVLKSIEELHLATGFGQDTLRGGSEADSLDGGAGDDFLSGGAGANTLLGGGGDDIVVVQDEFGASRADVLDGGAGRDLLVYIGPGTASGQAIILAVTPEMSFSTGTVARNFERIEFAAGAFATGADIILGGSGDDFISTGLGKDILGGGSGYNRLDGGGGDDVIASAGIDTIQGGDGTDTLVIVAPNVGLLGVPASWQFTFRSNEAQTLSNGAFVQGIERIDWTGAGAADMVTGGVNADALMGGGGSDTLDGGNAKDTVDGGSGDDLVFALRGQGADTLAGGTGDDRLVLDLSDSTGPLGVTDWYGNSDATFLFGAGGTTAFQGFERLTFRAGSGNDVITGGDALTPLIVPRGAQNGFGDRLYGGAGNDLLDGREGRDALYGEAGNDQLVWSVGGDIMDGGAGDDLLWIDAGLGAPLSITIAPLDADDGDPATNENETFLPGGSRIANIEHLRYIGTGAAEAVEVHAGIFGDTLLGGFHGDLLDGGRGADSLSGAAGGDTLLGGDGADTLLGGSFADRLAGGAGHDRLVADGGGGVIPTFRAAPAGGVADTSLPGGFADTGIPPGFADTSIPGGGIDTLPGLARDTLLGGEGNDTLVADVDAIADGGGGIDTLVLDRGGSFLGTTIDIRDPAATTPFGLQGSVTGIEILEFSGGDGDDDIAVAGSLAHQLRGGFGNDRLAIDLGAEAGGVAVTLDAAAVIRFGAGRARAFEAVTVAFGAGGDRLLAAASLDTVWTIDGGGGADTFFGGALGDSLAGGIGNDRLDGNGGGDTLDGFIGRDTLRGGDGDDLLRAAGMEAGEMYDAGAGTDTLSMAGDAVGLRINLAASSASRAGQVAVVRFFEVVRAGDGADTLYGSSAAETLAGGEGNDVLDGRGGLDVLDGGLGDDTYVVGVAGATIFEGEGRGNDLVRSAINLTLGANLERLLLLDGALRGTGNAEANTITGNALGNLLTGRSGDDTLNGREGDDSIEGDAGADRLSGGDGADTLAGGAGNDTLRGEAGADCFVFGDFGGFDTLLDFAAEDTILLDIASLEGHGATGLAAGALHSQHFGYGGGSWCVVLAGRDLVFDADGLTGSGDEILLAKIAGAAPVLGDFLLV